MSSQTDRLRGLAHMGASLLRSGAQVLDRIAGTPADTHGEARFARPDPQADLTPKDLGDVTIARKVESVLFRDPRVPQGSIDVNVVDGVVYLRGEAHHPEDIRWLVETAAEIPEVVRVEDLLHLPNTPAMTRTDQPRRLRKEAGRRTAPHSAEVHVAPVGITGELPVPGAEPTPAELAAQHRGRPPSPLGSHETGETGPGAPGTPPAGAGSEGGAPEAPTQP